MWWVDVENSASHKHKLHLPKTRWWTREVLSSGFQLKITRYQLDEWDQQNVALLCEPSLVPGQGLGGAGTHPPGPTLTGSIP